MGVAPISARLLEVPTTPDAVAVRAYLVAVATDGPMQLVPMKRVARAPKVDSVAAPMA